MMPVQTFRVYLGRAYPRVPASLTQVLSWKAQQSWQRSQFLLLQEVPSLLEPPKRSPCSSLLLTVPLPVGVLPSAATRFPASPPGRATDLQTTERQGRAGGGGTVWGALVLTLTSVVGLTSSLREAAASLYYGSSLSDVTSLSVNVRRFLG
ncbi:conserved hypothetical protein [Ktedonobacter racemifer DSM 44963]|uniref:Uncharacterized protein n=1 Tax=Ktedonobacter racemifer DSM 44963 TaxID=485913 RepID=D6TWA6_KTERA|nr:conserved hypothetical protein [Ktedonobacter racemifer DSM 44963]